MQFSNRKQVEAFNRKIKLMNRARNIYGVSDSKANRELMELLGVAVFKSEDSGRLYPIERLGAGNTN